MNGELHPAVIAASQSDPFLARIRDLLTGWVEGEWPTRQRIEGEVRASGWTSALRTDYAAAALTVENLATRLDNISLSKLRRELRKLGAPTPGDLIREARIAYAARLLVETRLLVREVAARAGYDSEKHFTEQFHRAFGVTPSIYRRERIAKSAPADNTIATQEDS